MAFSHLFLGSAFIAVAQYYVNRYNLQDLVRNPFPPEVGSGSEIFDFIIVGGGAAGCVLASRLSENRGLNVLLMEEGGKPPPPSDVPIFSFTNMSDLAFQYQTVPQKNLNYRTIKTPVGKVLGGTTVHNTMFWNRGSPFDFDNWADITGDDSWRYEALLTYFKKSETYRGEFTNDQHGDRGPIFVSKQEYAKGISLWLEAGKELGYPNVDPNGPQTISMGPVEVNRFEGRRVSAYTAYIKPYEKQRKNLKIIKYARVNNIILSKHNRAVGVNYTKRGENYIAKAKLEIIISAGAFGSPQILMRSGIGPSDHLQNSGITPRVNLPVGTQLLEHSEVPIAIFINDSSQAIDFQKELNEKTLTNFLDKKTSPLESSNGLACQGFFASSLSRRPDWPDIQFALYNANFRTKRGWKDDFIAKFTPLLKSNEIPLVLIFYHGRPKSVGSLRLNPSNVNGPPLIDLNFLSDLDDVQVNLEGLKLAMKIFENTEAYAKVGARVPNPPFESCSAMMAGSDEQWLCTMRETMVRGNHPCGTCPMGRSSSDSNAVVDSKLRVFGVPGLRVVDASIMPAITNTNLQAAVYMIAEKASEDILSYWSTRRKNN